MQCCRRGMYLHRPPKQCSRDVQMSRRCLGQELVLEARQKLASSSTRLRGTIRATCCSKTNSSRQQLASKKRKGKPGALLLRAWGKLVETQKMLCSCCSSAPALPYCGWTKACTPKKPWHDEKTHQEWFQPWFPSGAKWISTILSSFKISVMCSQTVWSETNSLRYFSPELLRLGTKMRYVDVGFVFGYIHVLTQFQRVICAPQVAPTLNPTNGTYRFDMI